MATIKLGSLTLGNIAIGNSTIGDTRKIEKTKMFRAESLSNHKEEKVVERKLAFNNRKEYEEAKALENGDNQLGGNVGGDSQWLLASGYWDDNGVWDDTQNWNE